MHIVICSAQNVPVDCGLVFVQGTRQKQEVLIQTLVDHRVAVPFVEPRVSFTQLLRLSSQYIALPCRTMPSRYLSSRCGKAAPRDGAM